MVLLGITAGIGAAAFLSVTGEPSIEDAIAIEQAQAPADEGHAAEELVSRSAQRGVGLFGAYALSGAAFGLLFGAGYLALGRSQPEPFRRALVAGTILAGALTVSPWLKYPPNPPAVGDPATLAHRQALYAGLVAFTAVVLFGAAWASGRLRQGGWPDYRRIGVVAGTVAVAMLAAYATFPPAPDPVEVPATLVWRFRVASLGGNLALWAVLTLGFGVLAASRARLPVTRRAAAPAA